MNESIVYLGYFSPENYLDNPFPDLLGLHFINNRIQNGWKHQIEIGNNYVDVVGNVFPPKR